MKAKRTAAALLAACLAGKCSHRNAYECQESAEKTAALVLVNPSDRTYTRSRFILWVGEYTGVQYLMIWADSLEDASEHMCDWVVENAPGYLCDESVQEEYETAIAEGCTEEEAQERAEADCTMFGHSGIHYIPSDHWGIEHEDPTRAQVLALQGRTSPERVKRTYTALEQAAFDAARLSIFC